LAFFTSAAAAKQQTTSSVLEMNSLLAGACGCNKSSNDGVEASLLGLLHVSCSSKAAKHKQFLETELQKHGAAIKAAMMV
jgi:hypothetical protein